MGISTNELDKYNIKYEISFPQLKILVGWEKNRNGVECLLK